MKRTLLTICIGTLALAVTAWGQGNHQGFDRKGKKAQRQAVVQKSTSSNTARSFNKPGRVQRNASTARFRQRSNNITPRIKSNAVVRQSTVRQNRFQGSQQLNARRGQLRAQSDVTLGRKSNSDRARNVAVNRQKTLNRESQTAFNREGNINRGSNFNRTREGNIARNREGNFNRERDFRGNRERNISVVNHWRGDRFRGEHYSAFRNYHRQWHHRDWWRHHHSRITFVLGGWYYWNAGYWYPAWGYDPGYHYPYDGPIYGYGDLAPDQVIVNVQSQLQRDGYYVGPVDGILGPMTRQAIAAFQADNGLAVTAAIDEPTLATLGLV